MRSALVALLTLSAFAATAAAAPRPAVKGLTQEEAAKRSAVVSSVTYSMRISVDASSAAYSGEETIGFVLSSAAEPLTLDFDGGTVDSLEIGGAAAAPVYNGLFLTLSTADLKAGPMEVKVRWHHAYDASGSGLYRFKDPEDGRVYVYSDFEPYNANRLFPCFDQPDLKAAFTLTAEAPEDWTVVSTARETSATPAGAGRKVWVFPATPKLSAYVFSLHAGPYRVWEGRAGSVPLRLFARRSLAPYVDPEEWFATTRAGLAFYGGYFGIPYPFSKYDQLLVPDYNAGAMENAGAVTFSERYVRRGQRTRAEREDLAETILHEMAHMWFGDLVTMRWWDGLWLNESFAAYMEALSAAEATPFKEAWLTFFVGEKEWAYREDQQPTTHPIEGEVKDTETAFTNFDGITYGKGAAVLKQLAHRVGEKAFRDGVRLYLSRHAFGNTSERDFFAAQEEAGGADLRAWTKQWLETSGVDAVSAQWSCENGRLAGLTLGSGDGTMALRPHRSRAALYSDSGAGLERRASAAASYEGSTAPVAGLAGKPCPDLVFPNDGDFDYVKVVLDERSLEAAKRLLERAGDPLLRAMLWHSLWEMVRDGRLAASDYARLALERLGQETEPKVATAVAETICGKDARSASVLRYLSSPDPAPFEALFWERLRAAPSGGDLQKLWLDSFADAATSRESLERLKSLLSGALKIDGLSVDQERRWELLERLSAQGDAAAPSLIDAEAARDRSDKGVKAAIGARAAAPDDAVKRRWFDAVVATSTARSLGELREAMGSLFPREQDAARERYAPEFFAALARLNAVKDDEFLSAFSKDLAPAPCTEAGAAALGEFLAKNPGLNASVVKNLRVAQAEGLRCAKARALLKP